MNRALRSTTLAIALMALTTGAALAGVSMSGAGVLHQYCADEEVTSHPRVIVMRQIVMTDELATFGGTVFAGIYQREFAPDHAGRMVVRVRIQRLDGSRERVGRFSAFQQANGVAEAESRRPVALRAGDMVIWSYTFANFEGLEPNECMLLIGAIVKP